MNEGTNINHPPVRSPSSKPILLFRTVKDMSFRELVDTFNSYSGYGDKFLIVRSDEKGISVYEGEFFPDRTYLHEQAIAMSTWTVNHNLGKYPSCQVMKTTGHVIGCGIQHTSVNQTVLSFSEPFAGRAIFN